MIPFPTGFFTPSLVTASLFNVILKKVLCRTFIVPDCNNLSKVQLKVVNLSDENGSQSLIEGGPIHINGGPYWKHESGDTFVHAVVLFQTLEGDGQGGRTENSKTGHVS